MQNSWKKTVLRIVVGAIAVLLLYFIAVNAGLWRPDRVIVVTVQQQDKLINEFERSWQRPPSDEERSELLAAFIHRELAYREATRLELGRDDVDIRRRLQQIMESLATNEVAKVAPTQQELQTYLDENGNRFKVDPLLTFRQIHFDSANSAIGADASARFILGKLRSQDMPEDISDLGDISSSPSYVEKIRESEIRKVFGSEFSSALAEANVGEWIGPVHSDFGLHLIYVDERVAGKLPDLQEIEGEVRREWVAGKQQEAVEKLYERLEADYEVTIE